ncbi:hypothetical protein B5E87_00245 [Massilimicrobiota sp. An142]|uniref:hypothetical protein n=1 Tax=Massilimicrobiota sp. An142 TaxID=1965564 RepID=UPI000B370441|nr:hypothetical protein [Massilimicrobiota sp. An142]OUQ15036.1 hypothetical protein B5E87_00245 [Massilimicrobiota sp. An142]
MEQKIIELKNEIDNLKNEIENIKFSIKVSKNNQKELYKRIDTLNSEIKQLNDQIILFMAKNDTATIVKDITDELLKGTLQLNENNNEKINEQIEFMKKTQITFIIAAIAIILGAASLIFPQIPHLLQVLG